MNCPTCQASLTTDTFDFPCPRCSLAQALRSSDAPAGPAPELAGYDLLHEIGRGGMGIVWLARERALNRLVALKVIASDAEPSLGSRLLREGQAAARLSHPHIVAIHALGGSGPSTFLAMDFLEGGNLDQRLREKGLPPQEAAALVAKLAAALGHAHAAGILHRDVKPSNILLDADGEPHLADFGLASALEGNGDLTRRGQIAGTPAYIAPELLAGAIRATPASDIYGLGAVLYACLTGRPPFTGDSPTAIFRQVAEAEPLPPRLWNPQIPRDLETICLHCLEKAPESRYPSAGALRDDLQHFLGHEPIAARPVGWFGKTARWCRRNPGSAAAIGLAATIVLLLAIGGPLVALRLERSRIAAADAATTSASLSDFFQNDLLAQASPENQTNRDLKLRTVLDRASEKIGNRFANQPFAEASIQETLGETYWGLGEYPEGRRHLLRALSLRRSVLGAADPLTLKTESALALDLLGLGRYTEALALSQSTWTAQRRVLGPEHTDTLVSMNNVATALWRSGKYAPAEATLVRLLELRRKISGAEDKTTLLVLHNLAAVYVEEGKFALSEALYVPGIELHKKVLGPEHPETLSLMSDLAVVYQREDRLPEAEALARKVLELRRQTLGPEQPATLQSMNNLGSVYRYEGKAAEAEALATQVLNIHTRVSGPEHPETLIAMVNLAATLRDLGRYQEAEDLAAQAVRIRMRVSGPDHPYTASAIGALASIKKAGGRFAEAELLERQALAIRQRRMPPSSTDTLWMQSDLGDILLLEGRPGDACAVLQSVLGLSVTASVEPWRTALTQSRLGEALAGLRDYPAAEALLSESQVVLERGDNHMPFFLHAEVAKARDRLIRLYTAWGKPELAAKWSQLAAQP